MRKATAEVKGGEGGGGEDAGAGAGAGEVKRSVAVVIRDAGRVIGVRRPPDDDDLPDAWGLPAASLREGETWEEAVRRAGREKLGVELEAGAMLEEGEIERATYTLRMRLFEASVVDGEPSVPQPTPGVTQYSALERVTADRFEQAAAAGSLCCRLYLRHHQRASGKG